MITKNGEIFFKEFNESIKPLMSYADFQKMKIFKSCKNITINPPYWTYQTPPIIFDDKKICFQLWFLKSENLTKVIFWDANEIYGLSWEEYSEEKEKKRNQSVKEWLEKECEIKTGSYNWGKIEMVLDPYYGIYQWMIIFE